MNDNMNDNPNIMRFGNSYFDITEFGWLLGPAELLGLPIQLISPVQLILPTEQD